MVGIRKNRWNKRGSKSRGKDLHPNCLVCNRGAKLMFIALGSEPTLARSVSDTVGALALL